MANHLAGNGGRCARAILPARSVLLVYVQSCDTDSAKTNPADQNVCLAKGQANAAQSLLLSLPSLPTSSSSTNQSHLLELASYSRLFSLFSSHTYFADTLFRQPSPTASKLEVHAWKQDLEAGVEDVWKATVGLVKERWLDLPRVSPEAEKEGRVLYEYEGEEERQKQLKLIRLIFIPDLILRLHNALTEQSALFPYFLQRALELASIVADGRYRVYEGFLPLATIAGGAEVVGGRKGCQPA